MISSRDLASRYAAYLHVQLMGDETEGFDFGLWLDAYWHAQAELTDEPCSGDRAELDRPASPISWIDHEETIIGLLAGRAGGCYRIPIQARPPAISLYLDDAEGCSTGSAAQERAFAHAQDVVAPAVTTRSMVDWRRVARSSDRTAPALTPFSDGGIEPVYGETAG